MSDLIGKKIKQELQKVFYQKHKRKIKIKLISDLVAVGMVAKYYYSIDNAILGVLGTGINGGVLNNETIITFETANFNKFLQTYTNKIIDKNSNNYQKHLWEKEVSGKYLFLHYNYFFKNLYKQKYNPYLIKNSNDLNELAFNYDTFKDFKEIQKQEYYVAKILLQKASSFFATQIFSLKKYINQEKYNSKSNQFKKQKTSVIIDGSLFWESYNFKSNTEFYLNLIDKKTFMIF